MDLLDKIRQSALPEQENRHTDASLPQKAGPPEFSESHDAASARQISDKVVLFQSVEAETVRNTNPDISQAFSPAHRIVPREPLEIILAGREAAGCGDSMPFVSEMAEDTGQERYQEFLCFKVSDEVYGIDIMDIKEVVKPMEVTEVPRAPSFVSGIVSLRGIIIPVIDMLDRLGLVRETVTGRERVIVVRQGGSFSGLLVDEIIQVVRVAQDDIQAAPSVLEGIDSYFVTGIGRAEGRMIILLNLANLVDIHLY